MNINRKNIYYESKMEQRDLLLKAKIQAVHRKHPAYGHRRIALDLGMNKKPIIRVMKKYGIKPPRRKIKYKYLTKSTSKHTYTNLIKDLKPERANQVWTSDLTYIKFNRKFIYLAVVRDLHTRRVLSAKIGIKHDADLALGAIKAAVENEKAVPEIFHSDQGTEFMAEKTRSYLTTLGILISVSDKASPWQNGSQESFFGRFKEETGDLSRFETIGRLIEGIYQYIHYYNHGRIHTSIKMTPNQFSELCLKKMGT